MILRRNRSAPPGLRALFDAGTAIGLTDGQLLERFATVHGPSAEPAFAALVERHGPMVWRVCRAILDDEHDAEDAFQATFLILVRRAGSLWVRDSLGPWLHRVASRAAVRARVMAGRRRAAEREAFAMRDPSTTSRIDEECAGVIHAEIDRLPDRYRMPVVLCDVEGRTYEEAARHLRCPVGTLKSRLARGRERLKGNLARRGIAGPAALTIAGADRVVMPLAPPCPPVRSTIRGALESAAGGRAATVAESVASLVREVSMKMLWESTRSVAGIALAAILAVVGAGLLAA
ncbi:MAG: RNA polymerase sigma factor, partial [Isosphaeraceae bacterium]